MYVVPGRRLVRLTLGSLLKTAIPAISMSLLLGQRTLPEHDSVREIPNATCGCTLASARVHRSRARCLQDIKRDGGQTE
jgi:hypothetical protein